MGSAAHSAIPVLRSFALHSSAEQESTHAEEQGGQHSRCGRGEEMRTNLSEWVWCCGA